MDPHIMITNGLITIGSILIFVAPFTPTFRDAPPWMRRAMFLAGFVAMLRAGLGFYLESLYSADPNSPSYWALNSIRSLISGIGIGILITLVLSREFWRRGWWR
jgi:hypothetical protein